MKYDIWSSRRLAGYCVLEPPEIEDEWELDDGIAQLPKLEEDVVAKMDPDYPNDLQLSGNLYGAGMPIISQVVRELIEEKVHEDNLIEFIPVSIINHKGRPVADKYFILHPLVLCDCINVEESGVEWNSISKDLISCCESLVLDDSRIPKHLTLFRLKHWGEKIVVCEDLVEALTAAGITGLYFIDAVGFTGMP